MKSLILFAASLLAAGSVWADDGAFLDTYYGEPETPNVVESRAFDLSTRNNILESLMRVDHLQTALAQTEVKSQGRRGTCSIFSTVAILEYNLKRLGVTEDDMDLSEQWVEFITAGQRGQEGSWSYFNFDRIGQYGFITEADWSYRANSWHPYKPDYWEFQASDDELAFFEKTCLPLENTSIFDHCLIGQENPRMLTLPLATVELDNPEMATRRVLAQENMSEDDISVSSQWVSNTSEIQSRLDQGEVVALDITFFYEAWNHRKGVSLGLGRDTDMWAQGIVSYPSNNSKDYVESRKSDNRAGHSIVLVGYDKDVVIERTVADRDGNPMTVKTTGVYYFKNSWGQDSFGVDFQLKGESLPGFGMISMDYAHQHGSFYRMAISAQPNNDLE